MEIQISDRELIAKSLQGDQDSFAELVRKYKRLIYSTVRYYIRDDEEVNDLSQEVFLRIYKSLGSHNPQYKFSTWSVTIAKNLCMDFIRKRKVYSEPIEDYQNECRDDDTPESKYISNERSLEIRRLIEKLPEKYRSLIILYHQDGLSYKEMAEKLNKPMSIIKNRLFRARMSLKESIQESGIAI